jgi:proprotein convertase subtilisin/kexin type 5
MDSKTSRCIPIVGYFDNSFQTAAKCPLSCKACRSLTYCNACADGFFMFKDNLCYATCPTRYYFDSFGLNCQLCPYDCLTCDKDGNCLSCDLNNDRRILSSKKRCISRPGFFDNLTTVSIQCSNGCISCTTLAFCKICNEPYFLSPNSQCVMNCP